MSLKQQRCSPLPCSASILSSLSSSSSSAVKPANKKLRFRRRQSGSHNSNGSVTGDLSSSQLSVGDCSTRSAATGGSKSKKLSSLLPRWMKKGRSSSSSKTDLVVMDKFSMQYGEQQEETRNDCNCLCNGNNFTSTSSNPPSAAVARVLEEAAALNELGQQLQRADQLPEALGKWKEGLNLLQSRLNNTMETSTKEVDRLSNVMVCEMISAHLYLGESCSAGESQRQHMAAVASLVQQLKLPPNDDASVMDCAMYFWEESPFQFSASSTTALLDLLMRQSCWSLALHIASKALGTTPADQLLLARLHLEVAMQYQDQNNCKFCSSDNGKEFRELRDADSSNSVTSHQARSQQLSHLGECHQLLLSYVPKPSKNSQADHDSYQALWQDLAQSYGMMGEEELALGCSQSRIQRLTATTTTTLSSDSRAKNVAFCHYEQALDVYTPVGQYGLALKEAELALESLRLLQPSSQSSLSAIKEGKEEDVEVELLLMKLYQFKADVLCRMGRITESIQSYEILLQLYLQSTRHGPIEAANVLYILGKLSVRAKLYPTALDFFDQELQMTQTVVGPNHMAISKILHELARVADLGMMDYPRAVGYYQQALQVESRVYQQCMNLKKWQEEHKQPSSSADDMLLQDAKHQIGETRQCLGKLYFIMGDFDKAVGVAVGK